MVIGSLRALCHDAAPPAGPPLPAPIAFRRLVCPPRADAAQRARHSELVERVKAAIGAIPEQPDLVAYQEAAMGVARRELGTLRPHRPSLTPWASAPRVKAAEEAVNHARQQYNKRKTKTRSKRLDAAWEALAAAKRAAKHAFYLSTCKKLGDGRMDVFYQMRRQQHRQPAPTEGGPLRTDAAVALWRDAFCRRPSDPALEDWEPLTTDMSPVSVSEAEVLAAIRATQPRSSGPDGFDVRLLRACAKEMAPALAGHFTQALRSGLPALLRRGRTVLISKSSTLSADPSHYRPITVLPVLARVVQKVVDSKLRAYITAHHPFSAVQAGFLPGRSTFDHIALMHTLAEMQRRLRKDLFALLLDYRQMFDSIPHTPLLHVLRDEMSLPAAWVEAVRLLLLGNSTTIFGQEIPISRGCPQGSPLSPLLCICYLQDLVRFLLARGRPPDIQAPFTHDELWILLVLLLYCDDAGLLGVTIATLQWLLDGVREWSALRGLTLSPKSQAIVLVYGPATPPPAPLDAGLEAPVPWVESVKYLGAPFKAPPPPTPLTPASPPPAPAPRPPPSPSSTMAYQLLLLGEVFRGPPGLPIRYTDARIYAQGVHQVVLARVLYPSAVLDMATAPLDTALNQAIVRQFGLPFDTSTVFLRTELNILPVADLIWRRRLRYAPSFVRGQAFQTHLRPRLGLLRHHLVVAGISWLSTALGKAGLSLTALLAATDAAAFDMAGWRREMRDLVQRRYAERWPRVSTSGTMVNDSLKAHLETVCLVKHLPAELARPHPVTGRLPAGQPPYIQMGGIHAPIGLRFKAYGLRCRPSTGGRHACLWCGEAGCECGLHLLTCKRPPVDVPGRVLELLQRVYFEAHPPPAGAPQSAFTRALQATALVYVGRLAWPGMTRSTLISTLQTLGRLINQYRHSWTGPAGARNPIQRVDIAPIT